jgi:AbrB family looped-hinge helix DNA binding protein
MYGDCSLSYTITEKGTVSIPSRIRKKYDLQKGAKVEFIDTGEGILVVPIIPIEDLFGVDKSRKKLVYEMVREIHDERRREASEN